MAADSGELYIRVDVTAAAVGTPRQIVPRGQPITGVIVNAALPPGLVFRVCRPNAESGIRLFDFDALTDLFCPPLENGLYAYWTPGIPGGIVELVILSGPGGVVTR